MARWSCFDADQDWPRMYSLDMRVLVGRGGAVVVLQLRPGLAPHDRGLGVLRRVARANALHPSLLLREAV